MNQADLDDILIWPDGTWCYQFELHEMQWMSDDYERLQFDSPEYWAFLEIYE